MVEMVEMILGNLFVRGVMQFCDFQDRVAKMGSIRVKIPGVTGEIESGQYEVIDEKTGHITTDTHCYIVRDIAHLLQRQVITSDTMDLANILYLINKRDKIVARILKEFEPSIKKNFRIDNDLLRCNGQESNFLSHGYQDLFCKEVILSTRELCNLENMPKLLQDYFWMQRGPQRK